MSWTLHSFTDAIIMPKLLNDIILRIISDYFWDDQATLRTTSLVCHSTRALSQRLLFHSIVLVAGTGDADCIYMRRLEAMSQAPATILSYVRAFGFSNGMKRRRPEERYAWFQSYGALLNTTLRRLALEGKLEALSIDSIIGLQGGIVYDLETISLFKKLCCLPTIDTLALTAAPGEMLQQPFRPALRHLIARNIQDIQAPTLLSETDTSHQAVLDTFGFYPYHSDYPGRQTMVDFLLGESNTVLDLSSLKSLTAYCIIDHHYDQVARLLGTCRLKLEALDLKIACEYWISPTSP